MSAVWGVTSGLSDGLATGFRRRLRDRNGKAATFGTSLGSRFAVTPSFTRVQEGGENGKGRNVGAEKKL